MSHQTERPNQDIPHEIYCEREQCLCESKTLLKRSLEELDKFDTLTSPDSLTSADDVLDNAFFLTKIIKEREEMEMESKKELRMFVRRCKHFTAALCEECRSEEDITALMDLEKCIPGSIPDKVEILEKAVEAHHHEFVAHRHTQHILNMVVYGNVPLKFRRYLLNGFIYYTLYTLLFPIWVAIFFADEDHKISKWMKTPFVKFVSQVSQFCVFLVLLIASSLRDSHEPSAVEYLIFVFVGAMVYQEIHEMRSHQRWRDYFSKWWNCIHTSMLLLFTLSGVLWLAAFAIVGGWSAKMLTFLNFQERTGHKMLLLGNSLFSVASVFSIFHMGDLCQVNSVFGPLQLSVYRMSKDIQKFMTFFLGLFVAFTLGVRNLYSYNLSMQREFYSQQKNSSDAVENQQRLVTFWDTTRTMFWALFGQADFAEFETGDEFRITQETGMFLFALFSICAVMVGMNMLIAMMNRSFEFFADDEYYVNWKFSRTRMWLEYIDKDSYFLPPPYNLFLIPQDIWNFFTKRTKSCFDKEQSSLEVLEHQPRQSKHLKYLEATPCSSEQLQPIQEDKKKEERKKIVGKLVQRYLMKKQEDSNNAKVRQSSGNILASPTTPSMHVTCV